MNKVCQKILAVAMGISLFCSPALYSAESGKMKIGIVDFKECVEESKLGKKEQASFEALKKQMESFLEEKDKNLNEIASKFNDQDYMDSLSKDAEAEIRHKFRNLSQELSQLQNQYYQTLSQTNYKIVQKITDAVGKAAEAIAKENNLDLIVNNETLFYHANPLDISSKIIAEMDKQDVDEKS